jgi:hypothetical protein
VAKKPNKPVGLFIDKQTKDMLTMFKSKNNPSYDSVVRSLITRKECDRMKRFLNGKLD